jgi:hypothetical protein
MYNTMGLTVRRPSRDSCSGSYFALCSEPNGAAGVLAVVGPAFRRDIQP